MTDKKETHRLRCGAERHHAVNPSSIRACALCRRFRCFVPSSLPYYLVTARPRFVKVRNAIVHHPAQHVFRSHVELPSTSRHVTRACVITARIARMPEVRPRISRPLDPSLLPLPPPPPRAIPRFRQSASGRSTFDVEHKRVDARSFIDQTPKPRGREGRKEGRKEDRRGGKAFRCHVRAITLRGLLRSGGSSGAVNNGYGSGRNRSSGRNENSYYGSISGSTFLRVH